MDHDKMRRGRPTVHSKWDEETAILAGDSLVALAYRMLLSTDSPNIGRIARVFTEGIIDVCEGQGLDKEFESRDNVTLDDYYKMIDKKTARLFVTSCELGALIGGGTEKEISALGEYGAWLGRAFQIQDDLLDILSSEEISGKTFGSDIKQGKKTFLVIRALQRSNESQRKKLMAVLGKRDTRSSDIDKIKEIFVEIGIISEAREIVQNYLKSLFTCLDHIRNSHAKQLLKEIPQQLVSRQS
jgi:geranylgeranyl diphosphate synthase type II